MKRLVNKQPMSTLPTGDGWAWVEMPYLVGSETYYHCARKRISEIRIGMQYNPDLFTGWSETATMKETG